MTVEMLKLRREQMRLDALIRRELGRRNPSYERVREMRAAEDGIAAHLARLAREHSVARAALRNPKLAFA